jgi:hypothetical protein
VITCESARELLLEAEPAELRDEGDRPLAVHLRTCAACGRRAAFLLEQTDWLRDALATVRAAQGQPDSHTVTGPARGMARRWPVLVPLALAAGIAGLLLVNRRGVTPFHGGPPEIAGGNPTSLDVQVPPGQSVAVFQTANPNVVVIWSY